MKLCWLVKTPNKAAYNWYCESNCHRSREQCRRLVQRCGYWWKRRLYPIPSEARGPVSILKSLSPTASLSLWSRQPFSPRAHMKHRMARWLYLWRVRSQKRHSSLARNLHHRYASTVWDHHRDSYFRYQPFSRSEYRCDTAKNNSDVRLKLLAFFLRKYFCADFFPYFFG